MPVPSAITNPIALCAYALSLAFGALGVSRTGKKTSQAKWQMSVSYFLAFVCIVGGLMIKYRSTSPTRRSGEKKQSESTKPSVSDSPTKVQIRGNTKTTCAGINVMNVTGSVTSGNGRTSQAGSCSNTVQQATPLSRFSINDKSLVPYRQLKSRQVGE